MHDAIIGATVLGIAGVALLGLGWAIGVLGKVKLINNYRAHPERYPDAEGLGRWMGWTLGAGGLSLAMCALAWASGAVGEDGVGWWSGTTSVALVAAALGGLARHRRMPPKDAPAGKGR